MGVPIKQGTVRAGTIQTSYLEVLPQVGVLVGMGVVFFLIAMWRFKFE